MASIHVRVMDTGVAPRLYNMMPQDVIVTDKMSVADAVGAILTKCMSTPMNRLTILAHGYAEIVEGDTAPSYSASVQIPKAGSSRTSVSPKTYSRVYGGYGLSFGRDDVSMTTVPEFGRLRGHFTEGAIIVVFGCAAADRGPYLNERLTGDGPGLMKALASWAGVPVRASDSLQEVPVDMFSHVADRGPWAGRTLLFMPGGRTVDESKLPMTVY
jgi:hypothetical protein